MAHQHGVYITEIPTDLRPTVGAASALPVVFGTAPVFMLEDWEAAVNNPTLLYSMGEVVERFGFAQADGQEFAYTLSEFAFSQFSLYGTAPVVFVNVLGADPTHKKTDSESGVVVTNGIAELATEGVIRSSIVVQDSTDTTTYDLEVDYTVSYSKTGAAQIAIIDGGGISESDPLNVSFEYLDVSEVQTSDIIGGINANTDQAEGLELIDDVFAKTKLVAGLIVAPKFSGDPTVAALMGAKASKFNGNFRCLALVDVPVDTVLRYSDVPSWKSSNNINDPNIVVCWPALSLGGTVYSYSTQYAGCIALTDTAKGDGVPYVSPSNELLRADSTVVKDSGEWREVSINTETGAYLNGEGIVTALNWITGFVAWGNQTAAYPGNTDVKDTVISIRRMFSWVGNTLVLNNWQHLDNPLNRKQIQTVTASNGQWLSSLVATGALLGGRIEFLEEDNLDVDLIAGKATFRVSMAPAGPNRVMTFQLGYDAAYLSELFG